MRAMDILMSIPGMLMAISLAAAMGPGLTDVVIAIAIADIPGYARVVRSSVLTIKDQEYIEAAQSIGASDARIILKHIIPNCIAPIIVQATLGMAGAILSASSELSGTGHPAADTGMGLDAFRSETVHHELSAYVYFPGYCDHGHDFCIKYAGRRPAGCA